MPSKSSRPSLSLEDLLPVAIAHVSKLGGEATIKEISEGIDRNTHRATQVVEELVERGKLQVAGSRKTPRGKSPTIYALSGRGPRGRGKRGVATGSPGRKQIPPGRNASELSVLGDGRAISELATALKRLSSVLTLFVGQRTRLRITVGRSG